MTATIFNSGLQATSHVQAITGAANVRQIRVDAPGVASRFLMVFDEVPTNPPYNYTGQVVTKLDGACILDFGAGRPFVNGVYLAISARADFYAPVTDTAGMAQFDVLYDI